MPLNLSAFNSNLNKHGLLLNNRFDIDIALPAGLLRKGSIVTKNETHNLSTIRNDIIFHRTEAVSLPGVNLLTTSVRRHGIDTNEKKPYSVIFSDPTISFICDKNSLIWKFFYAWVTSVYDFSLITKSNKQGALAPYTSQYKIDYETTMVIRMYAQDGEISQINTLKSVYPIAISDSPLNWGDNDHLYKLIVTFNFKDWFLDEVTYLDDREVVRIGDVELPKNLVDDLYIQLRGMSDIEDRIVASARQLQQHFLSGPILRLSNINTQN